MALPSLTLVTAIRQTANNLKKGAKYQWGHFGECNCGNLAQVLTGYSSADLQQYMKLELTEWKEINNDYCSNTNIHLDAIVNKLYDSGLNSNDINELEELSNIYVLNNLKDGFRYLKRNNKEDSIEYLQSWADLMEKELLKDINFQASDFNKNNKVILELYS